MRPTTAPEMATVAAPRKRAPGAGVKAADGVTHGERCNVMLDEASRKVLEKIGGGNLSLGVREAARRVAEAGDLGKFSAKRHGQRSPQRTNPVRKSPN